MEDWFDMRVGPAQIAKERAKARELRRTNWWQAQIQKGVCHYCGGKFPPSELTMDHIVPLSRGGHSTKGNIVPCCKACNNSKKYTMPVDEILAELDREDRDREGAASEFEMPDIPSPEVDLDIDIPDDPGQDGSDAPEEED
ncbi:MAG: HNH endonuclease [Lentisphaeria bacterium]|nr:HNH endonuclease [Lentisphaeria bacterium]